MDTNVFSLASELQQNFQAKTKLAKTFSRRDVAI